MGTVTWPLLRNVIRGRSLNNTFGMVRKRADGTAKPHQGWDFEAAVGTPAYAISDGKVEFTKEVGDYGRQICMSFTYKDGQTLYAFYAHMDSVYVSKDQAVSMNDIIGTTGKTGNAQGLAAKEDHLHFEIRTTANAGLGLTGRISPYKIYGKCPLSNEVSGDELFNF